jgi:hypothetical protein
MVPPAQHLEAQMVTHLLLLLLMVVILGVEVKIIMRRRQGTGPARSRASLPLV